MTTTFQTRQQQLTEQAAQIDSNFRLQRKQVIGDPRLSEQGKREKLQALEQDRVSKISALQEQAHAELADARAAHAKKEQAARRKAEEADRALFGDAVMMARIERNMRRMPARDVVQFVKDSASDWQRAIALSFAADIIDARAAGGPGKYTLIGDEQEHHLAMADAELRRLLYDARPADLVELEQQGRDLRHGEQWIESLDMDGQRRDLAPRIASTYENLMRMADDADKQARGI